MKVVALTFLLILLSACTPEEYEHSSPDEKHVGLLTQLLESRGIPFEFENGVIKYAKSEKSRVDSSILRLRNYSVLKFEQENVRQHFYSLLEEKKIEYLKAKLGSDGSVVYWPRSEKDTDEILLKTIEYRFEQDIKNGNTIE